MKYNVLGDTNHAGYVRLSDVYASAVGSAKDGIAASQRALYDAYNSITTGLIDKIYPVGSIYLSVNNVSPATFIGGTWTALSNGYILKLITSGTGGAENATSNTGTNNGNTGAASGSTANSAAFDSGAASGSTADSTAFDSGAASGNTGSHTLTTAEIPSHSHTVRGNANMHPALGNTQYTEWANTWCLYSGSASGYPYQFGGNGSTGGGGGHTHSLNSHKHSVGAHSHGLNSHKHSVGAHSHGLNNHTHTLGSHDHTPGMPANISVYGWKRTA